jgi:solute carrier family 25 phosphate transporter 23/24/25/41
MENRQPNNILADALTIKTVQKSPEEIQELNKGESKWKEVSLLHFLTGAVAGAVSRTATCPLERLKILRQTSVQAYTNLTIPQAMVQMYRNEGFIGFYKGNGVNVFRASPVAALEFLCYEIFKSIIVDESNAKEFKAKLLCGALTGITANTLTYPLDLLKTILSVQMSPRHYQKGIYGHAKIIYRKEGILGFYKGWFTTMVGIAPYIAIKMATFDALKSHYLPDKNVPHFDLLNLTFGAIAGFVSMTVTYPFDLVKRRMQLVGVNKHTRNYSSLVHCLNSMMIHEGPRGFFRGLSPCVLKMVPATAILFSVNERMKKMLDVE